MSGPTQPGRSVTGRLAPAVLLLPSLVGILLVLATTDRGAGVTPDSVYYLAAARNLLDGRGLSRFADAEGRYEPIVNWPPLYPLVLAAVGATGLDVLVAARWLSAALLGGTAFLVGLMVRRLCGGAWLAIVAALLTAVAIDMVKVHAMAWSEPPCIFFGLLGLLLIDRHIERPRRGLLVAGALSLACAFLARYAGLAYAAAGGLALLTLARKRFAARLADLLVFVVAAGVPMAAALVRNMVEASSATGRAFSLSPASVHERVHDALDTVTIWLFPEVVPWVVRLVLVGLVVGGGIAWYVRLRRRARAEGRVRPETPVSSLPVVLSMFVVLYLALVFAYAFLIFHLTLLDYRTLSSVFPPVVVLAFWLAGRGVRSARRARLAGVAYGLVCAMLSAVYLARAVLLVGDLRRAGLGYGRAEWVRSDVMQHVRELAADRPIYSNAPDAVYYFTERGASFVPKRGASAAELDALRARLEASHGVVVYFTNAPQSRFMPPDETAERLHLDVLVTTSDGVIYELAHE